MDNLTHGLWGLAVGALRRPDRQDAAGQRSATDRAVPWACVVAAELPDLDMLWPAETAVLQALQAHRGPTHSLLAAPLMALIATLAVRPFFRGARILPMFAFACVAVLLGHLLPDAWTGWGTRLFLPFSSERLSLDWTMVVDPLVTVPLALGALWGWRRRPDWRRPVRIGAAIAAGYVAARVGTRELLRAELQARHPTASTLEVFPSALNPVRWRFVVEEEGTWLAGSMLPWAEPTVEKRHPRAVPALPPALAQNATVREAMAWARLPVVTLDAPKDEPGLYDVRIADLRYHWRGEPTLTFAIRVGEDGLTRHSELERRLPR
jgi:inner membrane protein